MGNGKMGFQLNDKDINPTELTQLVRTPKAGGFVSFEGWVRNYNEGHEVRQLEYQAYDVLANEEGGKILQEACEKFDVIQVHCEHRVGLLPLEGIAVWVGASAVHRGPAFDACEYIIDQIKVRVPIWKKEYYINGDSGWVHCEYCAKHC
jgi:molybdopterin synthase catalytic subunit